MKKHIYFLICFAIFTTTSYAQKKGKTALPEIEKTLNTNPWQNIKTIKYSWLETIDKKQIDSIMGTSLIITSTEKPVKTFKKKS
jgi:hypothetical protein|nr:hypothetical protein [uncultured Flavobacterium sp.]